MAELDDTASQQNSLFVVFHGSKVDRNNDMWVEKQTRTFGRWINHRLQGHPSGCKVQNVFVDMKNGLVLLHLLEALSSNFSAGALGRYHHTPKLAIHELENIQIALTALQRHSVKLVNIGASDIHEGKLVPVLGLIWTLILAFQLSHPRAHSSSTTTAVGPVQNDLLQWVREKIASYTHILQPKDFTKSWQDGKVLCALVDSLRENNCVIDTHLLTTSLQNCTLAMRRAEEMYQIPALLDAKDMVFEPDEHSNMTYIALFRDYCDRKMKSEIAHTDENLYRIRLVQIFERYNSTALKEVDGLLVQYQGREAELLHILKSRYKTSQDGLIDVGQEQREDVSFCAVHIKRFAGGTQIASQCYKHSHPTQPGSSRVVTHFHFRVLLLSQHDTVPMKRTEVEARFSELFDLHNTIKGEYSKKGWSTKLFPTFPDKKQRRTIFSNSKSFGFLDTRQDELNEWLKEMILLPHMAESTKFMGFFELPMASNSPVKIHFR